MIHLSVAIGRFVEALFWAILQIAGQIALVVVGIAALGGLLFWLAHWAIRRRA